MNILYVIKIYFLALLKIGYEVFIGLLVLSVIMAILSYKDKRYFTKKINKLRRYMYGRL